MYLLSQKMVSTVPMFTPVSLQNTRLHAVKQEYGEGADEYSSIKFEQGGPDEDDVREGNTSSYNRRAGLTLKNVDVPDYRTRVLDDLSLCCSQTHVCPVCDPYALFSQRTKKWSA
jgi:hypothetical protein